VQRRQNCYKTKHSECKGIKCVTKQSILNTQAPKRLQNKVFRTPRRSNCYKTKHSGSAGAQTVTKQSILEAQALKLLQNKAF
jgi:hypothetical protein